MPMVLANSGKAILLDSVRKRTLPGLHIDLYYNPVTLTGTNKLSDFLICNFPGYTSQRLNEWSPVYITDSGAAVTRAAMLKFTQTSLPTPLQTVYGYIVWNDRGWLLWAEADPDAGLLMNQAPMDYWVAPALVFDEAGGIGPFSAPPRRRTLKVLPYQQKTGAGAPSKALKLPCKRRR